jgi:hypothetical protein
MRSPVKALGLTKTTHSPLRRGGGRLQPLLPFLQSPPSRRHLVLVLILCVQDEVHDLEELHVFIGAQAELL